MGHLGEEDIESAKVGLFSLSPQWFRHSGYEILEGNGGLVYIAPQQNATIEWYKPFEEFPQILLEFYNLTNEIREKQATWWKADGTEKTAVDEQFYWGREKTRGKKLAVILLKFINRYGPFGLFWQDVFGIFPGFMDGREREKGKPSYEVLLNSPLLFPDGRRIVNYDEYAKHFLPRIEPPFPVFASGSSKEERQRFLLNYSEPVNHLLAHPAFAEVGFHLEKKKEFENTGADIADFYKGIKGLTWSKYLETGVWPLGIRLVYEQGGWHIKWEFRTLLDALQLMHINNVAGTMGQRVKICALPDCNKPHLRKGLYCCPKHTNLHAKRAQRERERQARKNDGQ